MILQEVRRYDDDFNVWHSAYTNMSAAAHWHEEVELIWVHSGTVCVTVDGQEFLAEEGDLLLCGSGCVHGCDAKGMKNRLEFVLFDPTLVQSRLSPFDMRFLHITHEQLRQMNMNDEVEVLFTNLERELHERSPYYREIVRGMLRVFWYKNQRLFAAEQPAAPREVNGAPVQQALQCLQERFTERLTLAEVARQANVSEYYLSRSFKQYTGMNFVTYRNLLRLEKAVSLLQETTLAVGTVAFNCGFQDIRTFNRVFRRYTGHAPSDFRQDLQLSFQVNLHPFRQGETQLEVKNRSPVVREDPGME